MNHEYPRCEYCGKFISTNKETLGKFWDVKLIWSGGVVPEPSHDIFWHIECKKNKDFENGDKNDPT